MVFCLSEYGEALTRFSYMILIRFSFDSITDFVVIYRCIERTFMSCAIFLLIHVLTLNALMVFYHLRFISHSFICLLFHNNSPRNTLWAIKRLSIPVKVYAWQFFWFCVEKTYFFYAIMQKIEEEFIHAKNVFFIIIVDHISRT